MAKMTAAHAAAWVMEKEGITQAFGVPGAAINPLYAALRKQGTIARGPALVKCAQEQGWRPDQRDATAKELAADGALGHPVGLAAMQRAGRALGIAIASATVLCDLEVVSVGGGLSQAGPLLFDPLEESLRAHARLGFARQVSVVPAALGRSAGLVGAAALIFAAYRYWTAD